MIIGLRAWIRGQIDERLCSLFGHRWENPVIDFNDVGTFTTVTMICQRPTCEAAYMEEKQVPAQYSAFAERLADSGCFRDSSDRDIFLDDFERIFRFGENPLVARSALRQWFQSPEWQENRRLLKHMKRLAERES